MKKTINSLFLFFLLPAFGVAQASVSSKDIIAKINAGQAVSYANVYIEGDLDLTSLLNKKLEKGSADSDSENNSKTYVSTVTAALSFVNCTFSGKVLAYATPETGKFLTRLKNEVYNADFLADVTFNGCKFLEEAEFKYSRFKGNVSFAGSRFHDEAVFKYAVFSAAPDFSKASFDGDAIFKYVKFPANTKFQAASFSDEADFKYASFKSGADFGKSVFTGLANFKYSKFSSPNFQGASFKGSEDFKYTSVNGKKADSYTIIGGD